MKMNTLSIGLPSSNPKSWLKDAATTIPGMTEVLYEPLYDSVVWPSGGASTLTLFQEAIGGPSGKTLSDTNMDLAGQLSAGKRFLVLGIELSFFSGAPSFDPGFGINSQLPEDVYGAYGSGSLTFKIQSKDYLRQAPLGTFPPGQGLHTDLWMEGQNVTNDIVTYANFNGRPFSMIGKTLIANQNFSIELKDLPALPTGNDGRIFCHLIGFSGRNVQ